MLGMLTFEKTDVTKDCPFLPYVTIGIGGLYLQKQVRSSKYLHFAQHLLLAAYSLLVSSVVYMSSVSLQR